MTTRRNGEPGFTLVELMITIAILGIIAALAIPAFTAYVARSKTAEVSANLNVMFKSAASYYLADISGKGSTSAVTGYCIVGTAGPQPATPTNQKVQFPTVDANFNAIHFQVSDYVYFSYGLTSSKPSGGSCANVAGTALYTFYANGDLDGDTIMSTFELAVRSDTDNTLYHGRGFYIANEVE
jgi:prepilin-type N-terminal cleavage/methylation domain-containing protein